MNLRNPNRWDDAVSTTVAESTSAARTGGDHPEQNPRAVRLSAVVMAHPARLRRAEALRDRHPELNLSVVVDPAPDEGPSARRTARLAWQAVDSEATHHLVLQDDAVPCDGFLDHLLRAIAARPHDALSLQTEWGSKTSYAVRLAALCGAAWAEVVDHYVPDIGIVLPAHLARGCGTFSGYQGRHSDVAVRAYLSEVGANALVTVPNLVQHGQPASLCGHDWQGERPSTYVAPGEPGEIAWGAHPLTPRALPIFRWATGEPAWVARTNRPGREWQLVPVGPMLRAYGLNPTDVGALARSAVAPWSTAILDVPAKVLTGLWRTAFGLGMVLAETAGTDPARLAASLARPTARGALATMPGGALRLHVDRHRLTEFAEDLCQLIDRGVRQGHETLSRSIRGRRSGSR